MLCCRGCRGSVGCKGSVGMVILLAKLLHLNLVVGVV